MTNQNKMLLDRDDSLLLMVDLQPSMLNPCLGAEKVQKQAGVLIDMAQVFDLPILFTEQNPVKLGKFLPILTDKVKEPSVWDKIEFSCFENRSIAAAIEEKGRKTIILCGIETHICIFQTGFQALRQGYRLHVASDATSAPSELNHEIGLRRLESCGAVINTTEMIIFELLKQAGTPEFRSMLPILKSR